ncbi:hypothetical protein FKP32DRAFT_1681302 [Trametes sanguinea]|nr:hypothetical protein FKP32DRAFT_1681302 [Trametes sanguinea]
MPHTRGMGNNEAIIEEEDSDVDALEAQNSLLFPSARDRPLQVRDESGYAAVSSGTRSAQSASTSRSRKQASSSMVLRSRSVTSDGDMHGDPDPLTMKRNTRLCQLTDEEKLAFTNRKGKSHERPYTAWFETTSNEPRIAPLDLTGRSDFLLGDLFWHKSPRGVQLWIWTEAAGKGKHWEPILLGQTRESDGRKLTLSPTDKPSWVTDAWYRKTDKPASKTPVFIYKK